MKIENEMGVIVYFAQHCQQYGFEIVEIKTEYPDATIRKEEQLYQAEFEYQSRSFISHGHDPRKCDLIICWENNWRWCKLPVIELSNPEWWQVEISKTDPQDKDVMYWRIRARQAERLAKRLTEKLQQQARPSLLNVDLTELGSNERQPYLIQAIERGMTDEEIAEMFGKSLRTIKRDKDRLNGA